VTTGSTQELVAPCYRKHLRRLASQSVYRTEGLHLPRHYFSSIRVWVLAAAASRSRLFRACILECDTVDSLLLVSLLDKGICADELTRRVWCSSGLSLLHLGCGGQAGSKW